ncbi:MAG: DUF1996 domain-containing protein [Granulosicoccus sp.]
MMMRLSALAFLLLLPFGSLLADCFDTYTISDKQWHQISLPCEPPSGASTVDAILGDDMGDTAIYGTNWILFAYETNDNSYTDIGSNGQMTAGKGYWIYNGTGSERSLSMPVGSAPATLIDSPECPSGIYNCIEAKLHYSAGRAGQSQFNMIGVPSAEPYFWNQVLVADSGDCSVNGSTGSACTLPAAQSGNLLRNSAWHYTGTEYKLIDNSSVVPTWSGMWITLMPGAQTDTEFRLLLPAEPTSFTIQRITTGTSRRAEMDTSSNTVAEQAHGTRMYCPVSHFSYDDPVVHPSAPSAAHLHMFWGNTKTDAYSTADTLLNSGNASCEGGLNNKSSYWKPAVFNEQDEVVLPENIFVYYKSFSHTSGFDRNSIMPIPNGLQMLANQQVPRSGPWNFRVDPDLVNGQQQLHFTIAFPMCLQIDASGSPILFSDDNISHLSYSVASRETSSDCPASHPYRIPQLIYSISYDVPYASLWYLASDLNSQVQGSSLHADYFAAWDEQTMDRIVLCNRESKASCGFVSEENGQRLFRTQLPERFLSPSGTPVYSDSTTLLPGIDRTPFGSSLGK